MGCSSVGSPSWQFVIDLLKVVERDLTRVVETLPSHQFTVEVLVELVDQDVVTCSWLVSELTTFLTLYCFHR